MNLERNPVSVESAPSYQMPAFSGTNLLIVVLLVLLIFSFLGINLLFFGGEVIQVVSNFTKPIVEYVFGILGYTTGTVIIDSADIASSVAKGGIDVADGVAHSIGGILRNDIQSGGAPPESFTSFSDEQYPDLARTLNRSTNISGSTGTGMTGPETSMGKSAPIGTAAPDDSTSQIQQPITASKQNWCLVGELNSKRGCVAVQDIGKCMSGQIFPSQQMCLNPTLSIG
jgi:hypothetical protein